MALNNPYGFVNRSSFIGGEKKNCPYTGKRGLGGGQIKKAAKSRECAGTEDTNYKELQSSPSSRKVRGRVGAARVHIPKTGRNQQYRGPVKDLSETGLFLFENVVYF